MKIVEATAAPSLGSLVDPITECEPALNIAPRTLNIMIAKTDMTMHVHALKADTTVFILAAALCYQRAVE